MRLPNAAHPGGFGLFLCLVLLGPTFAEAAIRATDANPFYTIYLQDDFALEQGCGGWTAMTGSAHPAGPLLDVFFSGGMPGTSYTTLQSWVTGRSYANIGDSLCNDISFLCDEWLADWTTSFTVEDVLEGGKVAGFVSRWTLDEDLDGTDDLVLEQTVVVEVTDGGPPALDNTVIRETHVVRNLTQVPYPIGLRKLWDWAIGDNSTGTRTDWNDGPFIGSCRAAPGDPGVACDLSFDVTDFDAFPPAYVINSRPEEVSCPPQAQDPDGVPETGCTVPPAYLMAGTVTGPTTLSPPPTPPDLMQWGAWIRHVGDCFVSDIPAGGEDAAHCDRLGDTSLIYLWGASPETARVLPPGGEASFTQYALAFPDQECPRAVRDPCDDLLQPDAGADVEACSGDPLPQVPASGGASGCAVPPEYQWGGGRGPPTPWDPAALLDLEALSPGVGTHSYSLAMRCPGEPCVTTDPLLVRIYSLPVADAGPSQSLCAGGTAVLGGSPPAAGGTPPYRYAWEPAALLQPGTENDPNPTTLPLASRTTFTLTVTDAHGCGGADQVTVTPTSSTTPPPDLGPALRLDRPRPPSVRLRWPDFTPPGEPGEHFHVYRAAAPWGPFARRDPDETLTAALWEDASPPPGLRFYEVRLSDACETISADSAPHTVPSGCFEQALACGHAVTMFLEPDCPSERASHACAAGDASGVERPHLLALEQGSTVSLTIRDADAALMVLVYDEAGASCIAGGTGLVRTPLPAGTYLVLVDGPAGAPPAYTLQVDCE